MSVCLQHKAELKSVLLIKIRVTLNKTITFLRAYKILFLSCPLFSLFIEANTSNLANFVFIIIKYNKIMKKYVGSIECEQFHQVKTRERGGGGEGGF